MLGLISGHVQAMATGRYGIVRFGKAHRPSNYAKAAQSVAALELVTVKRRLTPIATISSLLGLFGRHWYRLGSRSPRLCTSPE